MGGGRGSGEVEVPAGVAGVRCFSGLLGRETNDVVCLGSWQKVELKLEGEEEEGESIPLGTLEDLMKVCKRGKEEAGQPRAASSSRSTCQRRVDLSTARKGKTGFRFSTC